MSAKEFILRRASQDDETAIKALVRSARINPTGLDWERFLVAESPQGEVIGCVQVKPHRDGSRELASLVVAPDWRGQGVARALIERFLGEHPGEIYLMCRSSLGPLYEKFGFRAITEAEMPKYFQRIKRLTRIMDMLRSEGVHLLVMKREGIRNPESGS
ncbi:MAG: GNAT family N-acetyltransferase [Anaerolineales bacterium]|jgi:amino-acid N-acetyltransferase